MRGQDVAVVAAVKVGGVAAVAGVTVVINGKTSRCLGFGLCVCLC